MTNNIITLDCVQVDVCAENKPHLIEYISIAAASRIGMDAATIQRKLEEREALGSTGMGKGFAIPHGKFPDMSEIITFFFKLKSPIDFTSPDSEKVDIIFLILAPENGGAEHLKILSRISRLLRDETTAANLRLAVSSEQAFKIIAERI